MRKVELADAACEGNLDQIPRCQAPHLESSESVAVVSGIESVKRMPAQAVTAACISATVSRKHGSEGCSFVFKNPYMAC